MVQQSDSLNPATSNTQDVARIALGLMFVTAGTSHLTVAREPFKAQVPPWLPVEPDTVVLVSGCVEISLGSALLLLPQTQGTPWSRCSFVLYLHLPRQYRTVHSSAERLWLEH